MDNQVLEVIKREAQREHTVMKRLRRSSLRRSSKLGFRDLRYE